MKTPRRPPSHDEPGHRKAPRGVHGGKPPSLSRPPGRVRNIWRPGSGTVLGVLFFAAFYAFVWRCIDPRLLYHGDMVFIRADRFLTFPIYLRDAGVFREFLTRPGGLAEYAAAYLCQHYYHPHAGALILTGVAWGVFGATDLILRTMGAGEATRALRFIPPGLLLVSCGRYTFQLAEQVALLASLASVGLYAAARPAPAAVRAALFAAMSAGLYCLAGGTFVLFAVLCALLEMVGRRRYVLGGLYLLAAGGVPLAGKYIFDLSFADACCKLSGVYPFKGAWETATASAMHLFFIAVVVVLGWRARSPRGEPTGPPGVRRTGVLRPRNRLAAAGLSLVLTVVLVGTAFAAIDADARTLLRAHYSARTGAWEAVLREARRCPTEKYTASLAHDVNRALFETGRMGAEMFSYPQVPAALLPHGEAAVGYPGAADTLFRLGRVNQAEHTAYEALEIRGPRPLILRRLAMISIVKHQVQAARVFLGALRKDIVQAAWAEQCLRRLDEDPALASNAEVRYARSVMPMKDAIVTSEENMLLELLVRNRHNRMAFDYLMAHYLLAGQLEKLARNIGRLRDFGCDSIPEHYAEGVALYISRARRDPPLRGLTIRRETIDRLRRAERIVREHRSDARAVAQAFERELPQSYFRYFHTGRSGGKHE